jgi:hypothetical protein
MLLKYKQELKIRKELNLRERIQRSQLKKKRRQWKNLFM